MIDRAAARLDLPAAQFLLAEVLAEASHDRRSGDEHRGGFGHHRIMAGGEPRRAEPGDRTEAERDHRHHRHVGGRVMKAERLPPTPPGRLARPLVSIVFTEPPPPEPSMMRTIGRRNSAAICSAISGFSWIEASADPPRTVKSSPTTTTGRPSMRRGRTRNSMA